MTKLLSSALLLFTLNVHGAANKLVSTLPTTNVIWMTNYVMVVLQAGLSNQTFLVPWTNIAQQINAAGVWTNAAGTIRIAGTDAGTTTVEIPNSASNSYLSFVRQADDNFPTAILNLFGGNTNGVNSHLTLVGGPGNEEIYFQNSSGVPMDLWPGQTDGANTLYLFNSFDARSNPGGYLLDVQNHGTSQFSVGNTVTTNSTPLNAGALLSAYAGVATLLHATSTNSLITVGASPFNYTNTAAQTIVVDLDAAGATTAVKRNGTQIYGSLVGGDHEMILKPGAYLTITYSLGTPIMSWTEL